MKAIKSQNQVMKQMRAISLFVLLFLCTALSVFAGDLNQENLTPVILSSEELQQSEVLAVDNNTLFSFSIPQPEYVRLSIFDNNGRELAVLIDDQKPAGEFSAELMKAKLTKGSYYYRLVVGKYKEVRKLNIIK
ncbi:MAG: T9SS type A sorting domain-containing protein [Ignavibacteria bacterium]|nr:T9SS type A sorting domain-containing protein [Ignavibacteria bacterium]